jgi:hypothetical protein
MVSGYLKVVFVRNARNRKFFRRPAGMTLRRRKPKPALVAQGLQEIFDERLHTGRITKQNHLIASLFISLCYQQLGRPVCTISWQRHRFSIQAREQSQLVFAGRFLFN